MANRSDVMFTCPKCGRVLVRSEVPRDADGRYKRHCGCRNGKAGRLGTGRFGELPFSSRSPEYKQLCRVAGVPGFRPMKHEAHVKAWKAWKLDQSKPARLVGEFVLHDEHVKCARKTGRVAWHIWEKHKPSVRMARINRRKQERDQLSEKYITRLLTNSKQSRPETAGLPMALIEVKRVHLQITRYLKEQRGTQDEECNATTDGLVAGV